MKINFKKKLKPVIFLLMLLKMCIVFSQNGTTKKRIIIDAGHGGFDLGVIGVNNIQEKDVVLNISLEILRLNKTILDNRFDMYLTRYRDTFVSLSDRGRLAKILKSDIFLSIHCNAAKTVARGMEVYVHNSDNSNTKSPILLGVYILNESTKKLGFKKRGVKFANFQVLRETTFCSAILIETGFVTNSDEAEYFLKSKNITAVALKILLGIANYQNTEL